MEADKKPLRSVLYNLTTIVDLSSFLIDDFLFISADSNNNNLNID